MILNSTYSDTTTNTTYKCKCNICETLYDMVVSHDITTHEFAWNLESKLCRVCLYDVGDYYREYVKLYATNTLSNSDWYKQKILHGKVYYDTLLKRGLRITGSKNVKDYFQTVVNAEFRDMVNRHIKDSKAKKDALRCTIPVSDLLDSYRGCCLGKYAYYPFNCFGFRSSLIAILDLSITKFNTDDFFLRLAVLNHELEHLRDHVKYGSDKGFSGEYSHFVEHETTNDYHKVDLRDKIIGLGNRRPEPINNRSTEQLIPVTADITNMTQIQMP